MRESVPHPLRSRLLRSGAPLTALLCLALAGCSGDKKGQIILALQTDMSMPADVTHVKIVVKADGVSRYDNRFTVDPNDENPEKIPATLSVVAGEKENETIELKIVALRAGVDGDEPRTLNKTVTTIPKDRIAMLRVPMQWLCTGPDAVDDFGEGDYETGCDERDGKAATCVAGACQDARINSANLPDFDEEAVFGGEEGSEGTCFPTEACFDLGVDVPVDMSDCTVAFAPGLSETGDDSIINFAVVTQAGATVQGGICSGPNCYVGLDQSRDFGWYELEGDAGIDGSAGDGSGEGSGGSSSTGTGGASSGGKSSGGIAGSSPGSGGEASGDGADLPQRAPAGLRRFQLPVGVCNKIAQAEAQGEAAQLRASTDPECLITKTPRFPTCGPWSSVGDPNYEPPDPPDPPDPPEVDGDGDGVNGGLSGGDDCDDNDNTVYPGALESCDGLDNDCDGTPDDACLEDLPLSHRVDFSVLTDFTSNTDYAIYQAFDATRPLDLDQTTLTFAPNAASTRYTVSAAALDWDTDVGELVPVGEGGDPSNCDDCFTNVPLEFPFPFYGEEYTTVFPSSNGYLTFGVGDSDFTQDVAEFLAKAPRIAAFWLDLDTRGPAETIDDEVLFFSSASKAVVTYQNIQKYSLTGSSNTFQFVLLDDGTIKISYNGMEDLTADSLAGITPGSIGGGITCTAPLTACFGSCVDLDTDPAHCGACANLCASDFCSAGACVGATTCTQSSAPCPGVCVGSCELDAEVCDGDCTGTCDGTCDPPDTGSGCFGTCDGLCTGPCYRSTGGDCPDTCSGTCYVDSTAECTNPTTGATGPCQFQSSEVSDPTYCADYVYVTGEISTDSFTLTCSGGRCMCTKTGGNSSVSFDLGVLPADVCESNATLRSAMMDECLDTTVCGGGCPPEPPANGDPCNEAQISNCQYVASQVYCTCMGGQYVCG